MKVGIDFGTTYSKIAYVDERGNLECFTFPGPPNGRDFIPSAVAYRHKSKKISVGEQARLDYSNQSGIQYCQAFKMLLPLGQPEEWKRYGWQNKRSPGEVTRDFFEQVLLGSEYSFEKTHGPITSLVVSVPEIWKKTANNPGTKALLQILKGLNLPVDHVRSEPVCAAAYYAYRYLEDPSHAGRVFNLLVCDAGGGTFDVSLCRVTGHQIQVLDFDGNGQFGWGQSGLSFDQRALQMAWQGAHPGQEITPESPEFTDLLHEFERVKIAEHDQVAKLVYKQKGHADLWDSPIYIFRRQYEVTLEQAWQAFSPVRQGILEVLHRLQARIQAKGYSIDQVAIVGGFGQFPFVERTILDALGIAPENDPRFDQTLNRENRFYAIALGAALIANEKILPVEFFPHGLVIKVHNAADLSEIDLTLIEPGQLAIGRQGMEWAKDGNGERLVVSVQKKQYGRLPVFLRLHGSAELSPLSLPETDYPPPGQYYLGLAVDESGLGRLVFCDSTSGASYNYDLGDINPTLTV